MLVLVCLPNKISHFLESPPIHWVLQPMLTSTSNWVANLPVLAQANTPLNGCNGFLQGVIILRTFRCFRFTMIETAVPINSLHRRHPHWIWFLWPHRRKDDSDSCYLGNPYAMDPRKSTTIERADIYKLLKLLRIRHPWYVEHTLSVSKTVGTVMNDLHDFRNIDRHVKPLHTVVSTSQWTLHTDRCSLPVEMVHFPGNTV